jgi:uncharacterized membrane protein HdeD (DUF308 family)
VVSVLLGALAIAFPFASSIGVELAFGAILLVAGLAEIARGVSGRTRAPSFWTFLFAVMAVAAGVLLLFNPMQGVITLTVVLAAFLLAGGAVKTIAALGMQALRGWGWLLTSGLLSLLLGVLLLAGLPGTAYWALGLLVGIDLIMLGVSQMALAAGLRELDS